MIDLTVFEDKLEKAVQRAQERNIIISHFCPTEGPGTDP